MSTDRLRMRGAWVSRAARDPALRPASLGYFAWIAYGLLSGSGRWLSAGLVGAAMMVVVVATQYRRRAVKLMDCTSLAYFAAETLMVVLSGKSLIQRYHLALVWGIFAIVAWFTLILGSPFTRQYTRAQMPREVWDSPAFDQMNRRLTELWSVIFTLGAVLGGVSMKFGHALLLGMIIPMACMGFGLIFSQLCPRRLAARVALAGRTGPRASARHDEASSSLRST